MRLLACFFIYANAVVYAQPDLTVEFRYQSFDFGTITESGGEVSTVFDFVNNSGVAIQLKEVKASCGCTATSWTNEPIQPGDSGEIMVSYNPVNRPGAFNKQVEVSFHDLDSAYTLTIKGSVLPEKVSLERRFPTKLGNLWSKHRTLNLGHITNAQLVVRKFDVYNAGGKPIQVKEVKSNANYMAVNVEPQVIPPKSVAQIVVTFNPTDLSRLGFNKELVTVVTDDTQTQEKTFYVTASVTEHFEPVAGHDTLRVPRGVLSSKLIDFKKIAPSANQEAIITFHNKGQEMLVIRKILVNCQCVWAKPTSMKIAPTESVDIAIKLMPDDRKGSISAFVSLFVNDPISPVHNITVKAMVD